jgi:hypothetical protein
MTTLIYRNCNVYSFLDKESDAIHLHLKSLKESSAVIISANDAISHISTKTINSNVKRTGQLEKPVTVLITLYVIIDGQQLVRQFDISDELQFIEKPIRLFSLTDMLTGLKLVDSQTVELDNTNDWNCRIDVMTSNIRKHKCSKLHLALHYADNYDIVD